MKGYRNRDCSDSASSPVHDVRSPYMMGVRGLFNYEAYNQKQKVVLFCGRIIRKEYDITVAMHKFQYLNG
ncbi:hypothetical protein, partial [Marinilabilia sp.]|uniref:hypothetical protein n=1 Tax=Marinilabilia sp. TaxID=2021252 RepID=UPI0025BE3E21